MKEIIKHYRWIFEQRKKDNYFLKICGVLSIIFHILVLFISVPKAEVKIFPTNSESFKIKPYIPPKTPPKILEAKEIKAKSKKGKPIPDPSPSKVEPVVELIDDVQNFDLDFSESNNNFEPNFENIQEPSSNIPKLIGRDVKAPVLIKQIQPNYPRIAKKAGISGQVILQAIITKEGNVDEVIVLKGDKSLGFNEAAIEAVKQWKYKPAIHNGNPCDVYLTVVVRFTNQ